MVQICPYGLGVNADGQCPSWKDVDVQKEQEKLLTGAGPLREGTCTLNSRSHNINRSCEVARAVCFLYLRNGDEKTLGNFCNKSVPGKRPWIVSVDDDPCLYIDFYNEARQAFEADEWSALAEALGGEPAVSLGVDGSGRHARDQQVKEFLSAVLSKFHGVVQDDYTRHCWTLQEVLSGHEEEGHPFFDYNGWYKEQQEK